MKQQYETAQKRIREETDLKVKTEQELIREQQRIRELTVQYEQQQKILKLKTEGLAAAQRKLRGASTPTVNFEFEMEKLIAERKELENLKEDITKREELIRKREFLVQEKTNLENRDELIKHKERLENQKKTLSSTEQRRLIEVDEAIEAMNLAIDYQNNLISRKEHDIQQQSIRASQIESPLFKINQLNENESKELCRNLFEKVIDLKEKDQKNQSHFDELQVRKSIYLFVLLKFLNLVST